MPMGINKFEHFIGRNRLYLHMAVLYSFFFPLHLKFKSLLREKWMEQKKKKKEEKKFNDFEFLQIDVYK